MRRHCPPQLSLAGGTLLHGCRYGTLSWAGCGLMREQTSTSAPPWTIPAWRHTPIFHAVTSFLVTVAFPSAALVDRWRRSGNAAKLPGHYEAAGEKSRMHAAGYAQLFFPGDQSENKSVSCCARAAGE